MDPFILIYEWTTEPISRMYVRVDRAGPNALADPGKNVVFRIDTHGPNTARTLWMDNRRFFAIQPGRRRVVEPWTVVPTYDITKAQGFLDVMPKPLPDLVRKRVTAFLLDIGVDRPWNQSESLVMTGSDVRPFAPCPRWVSDDRWADRYVEADKFLYKKVASRLGGPDHFTQELGAGEMYLDHLGQLEIYGPDYYSTGDWTATWKSSGETPMERDTFVELVDAILSWEDLQPEAAREAWEAENIERGEFVLPGRNEIEMYRMMDERNPFLWSADKLATWLSERSP